MKKLLSILALVLAISARSADLAQWCADSESEITQRSNERIAMFAAMADKIEFVKVEGAPSDRPTHQIVDVPRVRRLLIGLRCVRPDITWKEDDKGGFVGVVPACRCDGDFRCTLFEGGTILASFLLRHRRSLESQEITEKWRMVMENSGIEALYAAMEDVSKQG